MIIADLHIHSKFSRACSQQLNIENLEKWARIKGVDLLGTGDFTHPKWIEEVKTKLKQDDYGILRTKSGFPFVWQTEISLIYSQNGKGKRVHNIVLAPTYEIVKQITDELLKIGRVDYDGRPIFNLNCIEFTEKLKNISPNIEIIPAHIFTPWFSLFGSNSGFDSIKECFQDQLKHIRALETGLSSDPAMNHRLSQLDNYNLVSFSDLHSFWPWRIGREATRFDIKLTYNDLINALRTGKGLIDTIEVDPNYGKYHFDGHRKCKICMHPKDTIRNKKICPVCKRPLTIGVLHRIEELADREEGFIPKGAKPFRTLIPLSEILANLLNKGIATKYIWDEYNRLINEFKTEYNILFNTSEESLKEVTNEKIASAIIKNRERKIDFSPGFDGEYGSPIFNKNSKNQDLSKKIIPEQKSLSDF